MKIKLNDFNNYATWGNFIPSKASFYNNDWKEFMSEFEDKPIITNKDYLNAESEKFKNGAQEYIISKFNYLEISQMCKYEDITNNGIYFDVEYQDDIFDIKIDAIVKYDRGIHIFNFDNSTKYKIKHLYAFMTINKAIEGAFQYYSTIIFKQSSIKNEIGVRESEEFCLSTSETTKFLYYRDAIYGFNGFEMSRHQLAAYTKYIEPFQDFEEMIPQILEAKEHGIEDILSETRTINERIELLEENQPMIGNILLKKLLDYLKNTKNFIPYPRKPIFQYKEIFKKKNIVYYDFEAINPKISLFDNYKRATQPVQVSVYHSTEEITDFKIQSRIVINPFEIDSIDYIKTIVDSIFLEDSVYVIHYSYETNTLKKILKEYKNELDEETIYKIEQMTNKDNVVDTNILCKRIYNTEAGNPQTSIKTVEKFFRAKEFDELRKKFDIVDYSSMNISNGLEAQNQLLLMQLFGDLQECNNENILENLKTYCDQDVRMMIMMLYWIKENYVEKNEG